MCPAAQTADRPKSAPDRLQGLPPEDFRFATRTAGLGALFQKVRRNLQDYGLSITLRKTVAYLLRAAYFQQVYRIYRIDLASPKPFVDNQIQRFQFQLVAPADLVWIAQIESIAEWLQGQLAEGLSSGQICLVALDGDKVAGFNLIGLETATLPLVNLRKKLRRGVAWSEHIAVRKEFRKTGLGSQLRLRIFQELKSRGFRRLYGGTLRSNTASLSLARSVGFREIGDIHYRKIFSFEKWWYTRARG